MRIAHRTISHAHAPYLIAELGVNHDGSVEIADGLVRHAASAGADAVKFQLFKADLLMSRAAKLAAYQKSAGESDPIEMLRRLELSVKQMEPLVSLAHALGLHAIVTVFSVELVAEAERLPWDAYKTASPDVVNKPLLDRLMATGRPLIVSTGASTLAEVGRALSWLRSARDRLGLLQCVSSYPTPLELAELGGIRALREIYDGPVGYSDHTESDATGVEAVRQGACMLEKHMTYDRRAKGPDHAASLDGAGFVRYASNVRSEWVRLSDPSGILTQQSEEANRLRRQLRIDSSGISNAVKRVLPIEQDVRTVSRQSVTATRNLAAGHVLTEADVTVKRPGTGIPAMDLERLIGAKLARPVNADMPLMHDDVSIQLPAAVGGAT